MTNKKINVKKITPTRAIKLDTAHDDISKKLQEKKGISKKQADEEAGKILSASKSKNKQQSKQEKIPVSERYRELYEKLKNQKITFPKSTLSYQEEQDIKKQMRSLEIKWNQFKDDPEMSGVRLSIEIQHEDLKKKLEKSCEHDLETKYEEDYTQDARLKLHKIVSCKKCGASKKITEEEDVSEAAIWR